MGLLILIMIKKELKIYSLVLLTFLVKLKKRLLKKEKGKTDLTRFCPVR